MYVHDGFYTKNIWLYKSNVSIVLDLKKDYPYLYNIYLTNIIYNMIID